MVNLSLEDLGKLISDEVDNSGKVKGNVSFSTMGFVLGQGMQVKRKYKFLGNTIEEDCIYDTCSEAKNEALDDCVSAIKYFVKPLDVESTHGKGAYSRDVVIK